MLQNIYDTLICCKMITTIALADISMFHKYKVCVCVCVGGGVVRIFKIFSFSNFQVYNAVLINVITILDVRYPEMIHLTLGSL